MTRKSYKSLFTRSLAAAPGRVHFAAHAHHLWPDASFDGQMACWSDGARLAERKWAYVLGDLWRTAQGYIADELHLPDRASIAFANSTHDLLVRIVSAWPRRPVRILTGAGEFHSFRRQAARWVEAGTVVVEEIPIESGDMELFAARLLDRARSGEHDLIWISQVMFATGQVFTGLEALAQLAAPQGPWVVMDGYHGFMAVETNLSSVADRVFYLAGGYKYAMSGEGVAFLHAPSGFALRPQNTGWFAYDVLDRSLETPVAYHSDARRFLGATFDPSGLYRFVAVRGMLEREGIDTGLQNRFTSRHAHALLTEISHSPLGSARLRNRPGPAKQARFLAFEHPLASRWQSALLQQDIVTDVRGDILRIGFGLYQDDDDLALLVSALRKLE
ncbi:class V aminotransferase [Novosphingobium profundi]|uniref:class V aminotransferase n=1 Tax=Novosphingobium profundi TaxID=1774954 RepID=UPI001BDA0249|nr:class V aminotransferase [Novosphingobium profundi]MBT0667318.1 class V aminotransferase [Novosphingobium profundi]